MQYQQYHPDNQKNMDNAGGHMKRQKSKQPENNQNYGDYPKHLWLLFPSPADKSTACGLQCRTPDNPRHTARGLLSFTAHPRSAGDRIPDFGIAQTDLEPARRFSNAGLRAGPIDKELCSSNFGSELATKGNWRGLTCVRRRVAGYQYIVYKTAHVSKRTDEFRTACLDGRHGAKSYYE